MASVKILDLWTNQVGNSYCPQVHFEVWKTREDDTKVYFDWYMYYDAYGYAAYTNGNARSVTVTSSNADINFTGSININGITDTKLINSGSSWLWKTHSNRWVSIDLTFGFNVTWGSTYAATTSASGGFSLTPQTSYTISYNANGGTGAPSSQTKWHDENLTLFSTKPTRPGYSFQYWGSSANATSKLYDAGATIPADTNGSVTLYAVWKANTWTVKYNLNGGSGSFANQTKTYGATLKLHSAIPTKSLYTFKGWGTSEGSTTVAYAAGANYTKDASITLYAIWELAYLAPRITNLTADRCTSDGTLSETGKYYKLSFSWATDKADPTIKTERKVLTDTTWGNSTTSKQTGTNGTYSNVLGGNALDIETAYDIRVTVTDSVGSSSETVVVPGMSFVIDVKSGGDGVAFGKAAVDANFVDSAWRFRTTANGHTSSFGSRNANSCHYDTTAEKHWFNKPIAVQGNVLAGSNYNRQLAYVDSTSQLRETSAIASGADLDTMLTPGTYACYNAVADTLTNCPVAKAFRMEISYSYGNNSYVTQRIFVPYDEIEYARRYNKSASTWSSWKSDFAADTGWLTLNNQIKYRRIGKVVFVKGESSNAVSLASGSYTTVGTLPAGFRPNGQAMPFTYDCVGGSMWTQSAYVSTDGKIDMYHKEGEAKAYWRFGVSFPTDTSV